ncbi:TPA: hypothetical protein H1016_02080 [archaeon]|uniref:PKD/Chitinase domain-containing protein n=1 Tax=Candidatus Naiadarchaeum limnaeum TaxID=2756139 RepID=A0A832XLT5_9ARCH|nr:hypothetical protein [Candidatus Naiadarchaeum limnaeum]
MKDKNKLLIIGAVFAITATLFLSFVHATTQDAPAAGESALFFTQSSQDTDQDGVSDYDEINIYNTNPLRESTDGDYYDDGQELFGFSPANYGNLGGQMPSYVKWPGNSPFVASYPQIDFTVDPEFKVFIHKELHFANRTQVSVEHTFGTIVTREIASTVGVGSSHTQGGYTDVSNKQIDAEVSQNWRNNLNSKQVVNSQTHINAKNTDFNVGAKFPMGTEAHALAPIPAVYGKAYLKVEPQIGYKTTTEDKTVTGKQTGTYKEVQEGGATENSRVVETASKLGSFSSGTVSTTVSNEIRTSISVVDLYTIGNAEEWEEGWSQDTLDAAKLRFKFNIQNTGTDRTVGISDLRFTVKLGPYEKTYPDLTQEGISLPALNPGESRYYNAEVTLTLDELREFDTKGKVQIYVEDYNLGNSNEEAYAQNAYDGGVLFIVDDGTKDDTTNLQYYLVHAEPTDNYFDLIKRLNLTVPVGNPQNPKKVLDFVIANNSLFSIKGFEVADNAAWFVQTEGISEKPFLQKEATGGRKAILTYSKDSDNDFFPDRTERKIGTNQNDKNSFPEAKVVAAYLLDNITFDGAYPTVSYKVKLSNSGNYDAYGLEARLFSLNTETNVTKEMAGGAVRIKPNQTLVLNETLKWTTPGKMERTNTNLASLKRGATAYLFPNYECIGGPANEIIDGNVGTYSVGCSDATWQINLSNYEIVDRIRIFLSERWSPYTYAIYTSYDGKSWQFAYGTPGYESGGQWREKEFTPRVAKYVQIVVHGNTVRTALNEFELLGYQFNGKSLHELAQPKVSVLYNTPHGDQRFITEEKIANENDSIENLAGKMLHSIRLDMSAPTEIVYGNSADLKIAFTNLYPTTIQKSRILVSFFDPDGNQVKEYTENIDFPQGTKTTKVTLNTAELNKSLKGQKLVVFATAVDHNDIMIAETLEAINILDPNRAPTLEPISDLTVQVGQSVIVRPRVSDPDGDSLTLRFTGGLVFSNMGDGNWRATPQQNGTFKITVTVSDPEGKSASRDFTVYVNPAPVIQPPSNNTTGPTPIPTKPPVSIPETGGGSNSSGAPKCNIGYELVNGKCTQKLIRVDQTDNFTTHEEILEKPAVEVQPVAETEVESESKATGMLTMIKGSKLLWAALLAVLAYAAYRKRTKIKELFSKLVNTFKKANTETPNFNTLN